MTFWDHIALRLNLLALGLYLMIFGLIDPKGTYQRMIFTLIEADMIKLEIVELEDDDERN